MPQTKNHKDSLYFLVRDILASYPTQTSRGLSTVLSNHAVSKETIKNVFKDEVKEGKPSFKILESALEVQSVFLRILPTIACYEVIELLDELEYCLRKDKRITIKKLCKQVILRLFASLYFEYIIIKVPDKEGKALIASFKKSFSKDDVRKIVDKDPYKSKLILKSHGIELGPISTDMKSFELMLDRFY